MHRFLRAARTTYLAVSVAALSVITLIGPAGCSNKPPEDDKDYAKVIATERADKDEAFRKNADPIPANRKAELLPLAYFPIDPDYQVVASFKPSQDQTVIQMPTSTGATRQMRPAGTLEFTLKGQALKLLVFAEVGAPSLDYLTVFFNDLTSGTETYPAGRYLDIALTKTGVYELDFNRSYQPYCYYNASYECPYPPPENRLPIPIRAGERLKADHKKS